MSWARRATAAERIDEPAAMTPAQTARMLRELETVNRWLGCGSYRRWLRRAIARTWAETGRRVRVLDVGAGGGDVARDTIAWCRNRSLPTAWVLVDFAAEVCRCARRHSGGFAEVSIVRADALRLPIRDRAFDVVACSAFLHHFDDRTAPAVLAELKRCCGRRLLFNDLHRSRLAGWSIRLLTALFSKSEAIRHDGPLSVRRGFRRAELRRLLVAAGLEEADLRWRWPFRWCVRIRSSHRPPLPASPPRPRTGD